ncbi:MAG: aldo/keto reductase [Chloroflexi bacterium]|nr:aldo/keto reductase [Chloroflexota bacterium]
MQYRKFGKQDWHVSALGMGCMRLPTIGGDSAKIDEPEALRMLHHAIEHGVNYLDTAYPYHGGNSERVLGKGLQGGYRERVRVATKLPTWLVKGPEDFDRLLNEQLGKLQTDHIDVYLLHSLNAESWKRVLEHDVLESAAKAQQDGRIGALGFSFHDSVDAFKTIVDGYDDWAMCQIQYNYMNEEEQAGTEGLLYAAERGLAVVIMEPLLGGRLANSPAAVRRIWEAAPPERSAVEWALQWLWNKPEVTSVLSGMSTMGQLEENLAIAARSGVGVISAAEEEVVARARDAYAGLAPIPCTGCEYCMPCPSGVKIPTNFSIYNEGNMYAEPEAARRHYARLEEGARASACVACRQCEEHCPQGILISEWMPTVHAVLGEGAPWARQPA